MSSEQIVALLVAERNRLDGAIDALRGSVKRHGRLLRKKRPASHVAAPAPVAPKRTMSAAGRKAIADSARKRWAAVHAAKKSLAPSPVEAETRPQHFREKGNGRRGEETLGRDQGWQGAESVCESKEEDREEKLTLLAIGDLLRKRLFWTRCSRNALRPLPESIRHALDNAHYRRFHGDAVSGCKLHATRNRPAVNSPKALRRAQ